MKKQRIKNEREYYKPKHLALGMLLFTFSTFTLGLWVGNIYKTPDQFSSVYVAVISIMLTLLGESLICFAASYKTNEVKKEKQFLSKIKSIKKRYFLAKIKSNAKQFLIGLWEFVVLMIYINFYFMCFVGFITTMMIAIYLLAKEGKDITLIASRMKWVAWSGIGMLIVIIMDKINRE